MSGHLRQVHEYEARFRCGDTADNGRLSISAVSHDDAMRQAWARAPRSCHTVDLYALTLVGSATFDGTAERAMQQGAAE